jgi:hypothetical protein
LNSCLTPRHHNSYMDSTSQLQLNEQQSRIPSNLFHPIKMNSWTKAEIALRNAHISKFHAPYFAHLKAGTPEYIKLARSGLVWDKIHRHRKIAPWKAAESKLSSQPSDIDLICKDLNLSKWTKVPQLAQGSIPMSSLDHANFAFKGCQIEHNTLTSSDASKMHALLPKIPLHISPILSALNMKLSSAENLTEFMHISSIELRRPRKCAISLFLSKPLCANSLEVESRHPEVYLECQKDSSGTHLYAIFPYPAEVLANMQFWAEWSTKYCDDRLVHTILKAVWMMVYLVSVHPFQDGNGRLSRTVMAAHMAKNGLVSMVCSPYLQRDEYIEMIEAARQGEPEVLCKEVVCSQLIRLRSQVQG